MRYNDDSKNGKSCRVIIISTSENASSARRPWPPNEEELTSTRLKRYRVTAIWFVCQHRAERDATRGNTWVYSFHLSLSLSPIPPVYLVTMSRRSDVRTRSVEGRQRASGAIACEERGALSRANPSAMTLSRFREKYIFSCGRETEHARAHTRNVFELPTSSCSLLALVVRPGSGSGSLSRLSDSDNVSAAIDIYLFTVKSVEKLVDLWTSPAFEGYFRIRAFSISRRFNMFIGIQNDVLRRGTVFIDVSKSSLRRLSEKNRRFKLNSDIV